MRPTSGHYGEIVTDKAIPLIAEGGCAAVTLRSLADLMRMTPPGVRRWFGSTEEMWVRIAACSGRRWIQWLGDLRREDPLRAPMSPQRPQALLPLDAGEVPWVRVWLALLELGRQRPAVGDVLGVFEAKEVGMAHRLAAGLSEDATLLLVALVRGLRHSVCAGGDPLPLASAHRLLTDHLDRLAQS
jgi:AcrR family transcriptional regulator